MKAKIFVGPRCGKTKIAELIAEFVGKEKTAFLCARNGIMEDDYFFFSSVPDNAEFLIIDDCPPDFDYSKFYQVEDTRPYGGELKFKIIKNEKMKPVKTILVSKLIFTTQRLSPQWSIGSASFDERFEIIHFPLDPNWRQLQPDLLNQK